SVEPITWLLNVTVKPGKFMDLEKSAGTYDKPVLDGLVARGDITSWGLAYQVVGPPHESYMYWVTARDWSAMAKVDKAFEDSRKGMKEDELEKMMDSYLGATVAEKETSAVVRHIVVGSTPGSRPGYLMRHVYKVKPGKGAAVKKMYQEYEVPVFKKLLAAGTISGYGLAVPEMHTGGDWTHTMWVTFADMAKIDAIDAAFEEADKARGEATNDALAATWTSMHDMDAHWDSLMKVSMYGGK
ncbi:MAG: hypothetical protein ACOY3Y_15450, partial [Acidobacteriota bacterium]